MTQEMKIRVVSDRLNGVTLQEVAKTAGKTQQTIRDLFHHLTREVGGRQGEPIAKPILDDDEREILATAIVNYDGDLAAITDFFESVNLEIPVKQAVAYLTNRATKKSIKSFSEPLLAWQHANGYSNKRLAKAVGCSVGYLQMLASNTTHLRLRRARRIQEVTGLSLRDLYARDIEEIDKEINAMPARQEEPSRFHSPPVCQRITAERRLLMSKQHKKMALIAAGIALPLIIIIVFIIIARGRVQQPPATEPPKPSGDVVVDLPAGWGETEFGPDNPNPVDPDGAECEMEFHSGGAVCLNNKVLSVPISEGNNLYVGMDLGEDAAQEAIYLNLHCDMADNDRVAVGYAVRSSNQSVYTVGDDWRAWGQFGEDVCNYVVDRAYDRVRPSTYTEYPYTGTTWDAPLAENEQTGTTFYIRVINLRQGTVLGNFQVDCVYNERNGTYQLGELTSSDVLATGAMTEEDRTALIQWAYDSVSQASLANINSTATETIREVPFEEVLANSFVEHRGTRTTLPGAAIYGRMYSATDVSAFLSKYKDLYAIDLYCGAGQPTLTLYMTSGAMPDYEVSASMPCKNELVTSKQLWFCGEDYFFPSSFNDMRASNIY